MSDEYVLPEGWEAKSLGETAKLVKDKVEPSTVPDVQYVGLEHVEAHTMRLLGSGRGSDVKSAKTRFRAGDVLYGKLRPYLNKVARPLFDGISSTDFLVFTESNDLDSAYLAQFLNQLSVANFAHHLSAGVELPRVDWKSLASLPITFPSSKRQQRAIVQSIEHARTLAASTGAHLSRAKTALDRFRQAILAAACSGRLTADWREKYPQRAAVVEVQRAQGIIPLVDTPDEWAWAQLADIADVRGGIQKGAKLKPGEPSRQVPYLRVANVQRGWLDLSEIKNIEVPESRIAGLVLQYGDILFNEGGDRDKLGRGWVWEGQVPECVHQNHVFRARLKKKGMQPRFYSWFGNTIGAGYFIDQGKQTVNLASLSMTKLRELPVPIPPIEEQAEIIRRVDELLRVADRLQRHIAVIKQRVSRSTQATLAKAFRGELIAADEGV